MKFVLFIEGHTERGALPGFFRRWLSPRLPQPVGIVPVRFSGWAQLVKDAPRKAALHLAKKDVIAVISLLDLYGPDFYPPRLVEPDARCDWARKHLEQLVGQDRFHQFFAVHELEAWLFSDPSIFPRTVQSDVQQWSRTPERVDSDKPPSKRLDRLYLQRTGRGYKKKTEGNDLFSKLDPDVAYKKCPHLANLLDSMLQLARQALGSTDG